MTRSHESLVAAQFGAHAQAYVESKDHAQGADLERLAALVAARPPGRVLDLGCGGGHVSFTLAPHAREIVAYDLSPDMLAAVAGVAADRGLRNIVTECGAAEALPFPDESFDVVASRYSAHHWRDLAAGLAGIRRVLKPDGMAIIMDVVSPGEALRDTFLQSVELLRDPTHVRDYAPDEWIRALRAAGLHPMAPVPARLRLHFATWIARSGTPDVQVQAILALQGHMPKPVTDHFAFEPDGTMTVDTMMIEATREAVA
ncbi:class I SAM-dependent methyltransferase [Beijerinckia sp. L45]|uniref:class I SAM-dependent methyltransferase n=1 Tax=Beijerinckia sp. L45 TaxID=1641855 RepID=UPI00131AD49D|nr:class I SAM-dependent methyltransferase [Beijerinckia sp. L45]